MYFPVTATAAPMAATAAAKALLRPETALPRLLVFFSASSSSSAASSTSSPNSSAESPPSSMSSSKSSRASSVSCRERSKLFSSALASLSFACHAWVRRSFSPKDWEAFSKAADSISTLFFCASTVFSSTSCRAERADTDLSFFPNWDSTSFISEPKTLKAELISERDFLNSFSPSRPIFKPNLSAIVTHLLSNAGRENLFYEAFPQGLCLPGILPVALPQIHKEAEGHQPDLLHGQVELGCAIIQKPGKQFFAAYSAAAFFGSASLRMFRLVPRYIASIRASLYRARSEGTVSSSTVSSVSSSLGLSLWVRL